MKLTKLQPNCLDKMYFKKKKIRYMIIIKEMDNVFNIM